MLLRGYFDQVRRNFKVKSFQNLKTVKAQESEPRKNRFYKALHSVDPLKKSPENGFTTLMSTGMR